MSVLHLTPQEAPAAGSSEREALLRAAQAYDTLNGRIIDLEAKLKDALVALDGRYARIEQLERAIKEDAERHAQYANEIYVRSKDLEDERDNAIWERDQVRIVYASLKALLDSIELPPRPIPTRQQRDKTDEEIKLVGDPLSQEEYEKALAERHLRAVGVHLPAEGSRSTEPSAAG